MLANIQLRNVFHVLVSIVIVVAVLAAGLYATAMAIGLLPSPWTCLIVSRQTISNPAGMAFEMIHTNCDLVAKWERVVVYARKRGDIRRTRLFEYDPIYDAPLPSIMVPNDKNIVVEVPSISSVVFQLNEWDGRQVSYRIGKIFYPDPTLDSKTVPAPP